MRTIKKLFTVAASVLVLAACAKESCITPQPAPETYLRKVTLISGKESKTMLGADKKTTTWDNTPDELIHLWENEVEIPIVEDDQVGVLEPVISEDKKTMRLDAYMYFDRPETTTYYSVIGKEVTKTSAVVQTVQHPAVASFDPEAEILVSLPVSPETDEMQELSLKYSRPVSVAVMTLKGLTPGDKVQKVTINADADLTGEIGFDYNETGVRVTYPTADSDGTGKSIVCNYTENNVVGEGGQFPVYFISLNATVNEFFIEVTTDKFKYERKTGTLKTAIALNDNRVATFGFGLDKADRADNEKEGFYLVEETLDDWSGDYLIVYNNTNAMNTHSGNQNANTFATYADISSYYDEDSKSIEANETTNALIYRAAKTTNGYSLYCVSDKSYLGITSNTTDTGSKLRWDTAYSESKCDWTLGVGSIGNIGSNTLFIRWNNNSGTYRFAAYKEDGQQPVQLYKYQPGGDGLFPLHTPENIVFDSTESKFTWDEVENAASYTLTYSTENGEPIEVKDIETNSFTPESIADEYYKAAVIAHPVPGSEKYKDSPAGENAGWLKVGTPKMPKIASEAIGVSMTDETITIEWEAVALQYYKAYISTVKTDESPATVIETKDDLLFQTETGTVTFGEDDDKHLSPNTSYNVYLVVKGKTLIDGREYADSDPTLKMQSTAKPVRISEINATGKYFVKSAVICAKAENSFLVKDNVSEGAGYIRVNRPTDLNIGDVVSIGGAVEKNNNQYQFNGETSVEKKDSIEFSQPTPSPFTTFTYAAYVTAKGKTSGTNSGSNYLTVTQSDGGVIKLLVTSVKDKQELGADLYIEVTGYLVYQTSGATPYPYIMATKIKDNTISLSDSNLEWTAEEKDVVKSIEVTSDADDWTFSPESDDNWNIGKDGNQLKISPKYENESAQKKELMVNIIHGSNTTLKTPVTLTQKGKLTSYNLVTSVDDLFEGDIITFGLDAGPSAGGGRASGGISGDYLSAVSVEFVNGVLKSNEALQFKLGKDGDYWTFKNGENYLGATAVRKLTFDKSVNNFVSTWTINIDDNHNAKITSTGSGYGTLYYNYNNGSNPRFLNYTSSQTAIQLYKKDNGIHPTGVSLNVSDISITEGADTQLIATIKPADAGNKSVTWTSSKEAVATVDKGKVTAVSPGEAIITVTTKDGEYTATCKVTVTALPSYEITCTVPGGNGEISTDPTTAKEGTKVTINATPDAGYSLHSLSVKKTDGTPVIISSQDNSFTMPDGPVTVTAVFGQQFKEAVYTVESTTSVTPSGDVPSGSTATFNNTYNNNKEQLTGGNTMTLTLSGFKGKIVKKITLSMHSNSSGGAGYLEIKAGSTELTAIGSPGSGVAFNDASWNGSYTTSYTDVVPTMTNNGYTVKSGDNVVIKIGATVNSLYCEKFTVSYVDDPNYSEQNYSIELTQPDEGEIKADRTKATEGEQVTLSVVTAPNGKELDKWDVKDASGNSVTVTDNKFTMPASNVTVSATFKEAGGGGSTPIEATFGSDWNSVFGTSYSGTISGIKANSLTLEGTVNNASIKVTNGSSTNGYVKTSDFRAYNGYTITLTAPTGKNITSISSTKGGKNFSSGVSANVGTLSISDNTISWSGSSISVVLSISGTVSFATIIVTYE